MADGLRSPSRELGTQGPMREVLLDDPLYGDAAIYDKEIVVMQVPEDEELFDKGIKALGCKFCFKHNGKSLYDRIGSTIILQADCVDCVAGEDTDYGVYYSPPKRVRWRAETPDSDDPSFEDCGL